MQGTNSGDKSCNRRLSQTVSVKEPGCKKHEMPLGSREAGEAKSGGEPEIGTLTNSIHTMGSRGEVLRQETITLGNKDRRPFDPATRGELVVGEGWLPEPDGGNPVNVNETKHQQLR